MKVIIILVTFAIAIFGGLLMYREYFPHKNAGGVITGVEWSEQKAGGVTVRTKVEWEEAGDAAEKSLFKEAERIFKTRVEWMDGEGPSSVRTAVEWFGGEDTGYLFKQPPGKGVKTTVDWVEAGGPGSVRTRIEWFEKESCGSLFRE